MLKLICLKGNEVIMKNKLQLYTMLLFLLILFFFLLTSLLGFLTAIRPVKFVSEITPNDLGLDYQEVFFVTSDGLTLSGWFIPRQTDQAVGANEFIKENKTIILLHGYPADKGDILPSFNFLVEYFNLFLFDFRYFGQSEGSYSSAGAKEIKDILAAIDYLKSQGIKEVGVYGFSMGGAVALMTAPLAPQIRAVAAEASYARLDQMAPDLYLFPVLKYPLGWLSGLWGRIFLGIDIHQVSPAESVRTADIPILIIHSPADRVIPFSHALKLKQALKVNPRAEFWFPDDAFHGFHRPEFQARLKDFFIKNL